MKPGTMLSKALIIATNAHAGQFDKAGKPYILHPLTVMHLLQTQDEELMCIALLHDCCEDTYITPLQLAKAGMSFRIVNTVALLTKLQGETYEKYKLAVKSSKDATLVKMADLQHNSDMSRLKEVGEKDVQRTVQYHSFYKELEEALKMFDTPL